MDTAKEYSHCKEDIDCLEHELRTRNYYEVPSTSELGAYQYSKGQCTGSEEYEGSLTYWIEYWTGR
jgi:hypothetical protein